MKPKTSYTPGPWRQDNNQNGAGVSRPVVKAKGRLVADCAPNSKLRGFAECEANARLIAAAPEMLEALEAISYAIDGFGNDLHNKLEGVQLVRDAIAKATGGAE